MQCNARAATCGCLEFDVRVTILLSAKFLGKEIKKSPESIDFDGYQAAKWKQQWMLRVNISTFKSF